MNIIRLAASRLDVTITELADLLDIPYRTVYKWESGEREPPAAAVTAVKLLMFVEAHNLKSKWITERNSVMNTNKLISVAEAIMDSAAEEYRSINLENTFAVQTYAENGMDIYLTDTEAKQVLDACKSMMSKIENGEIPGTNEWYYLLKSLTD